MISCGTILLLCLAVRFMFLHDTVKCLCVLSLFFAHVKNRFCLFVSNKTHVPLASRSLPCYSVVAAFCQGEIQRVNPLFSYRNTQFQSQLIDQIGILVHVPLPFRNILSVKALCISKANIDAA